ncbi:hypothetical protein CXG81DRAFT_26193 [Caulochytrium protostelioides]|uniref:Myosin-Ie n=1 Tax=Caulochytrium protostelioides TaxID=1555241 RepID=A0A4P9WWX9_9FUNG|nr:myosin-Ie [Caulochytrium protostelioides]RKP01134.1 hypothetical protein CXG81DRAFT_26193 [Caulochytrium protostelioides]|eukprot:RKP01134.1 hypothetical protein CXG81DRAFT_26193 [Caulochytrium protostelioides]
MSFTWTSKNTAQNGVEDMVLLSKVSEDQITENLKKRISNDLMFTYIGPTLVCVNPYKKLPYFTEKEIEQYAGAQAYEHPPHIYAVADKMFQSMITDEENQCVIISGESGAGKTEAAKLVMNYIAAVSGRGGSHATVVEDVKRIILESNPLLESFGNAKTLRNNNSSRFGKYFEINFTKGGHPMGGKISNFLLEKSRVVQPGKGERNYHVFYQLTKGCDAKEREAYGMMDPNYFSYLNLSEEYNADGIDDRAEFMDLKKAMQVCAISPQNQHNLLSLVAGILHLGNVDFIEEGNNAVIADRQALAFPAYLFGVAETVLEEKLISRFMTTGGGIGRRGSAYNVPLNLEQARGTRDALAKAVYSRMFDWIVGAVNGAMAALAANLRERQILCLGVLDIFGFEIFDKNGFEQFCINYVNEKLQQIFIELTLKQEQEEYAREGIQWTPIAYFNNKIVVDLIESKKPPGVMAILDDVCFTMHAVSEGADLKFVSKLDGAIHNHPHYAGQQTHFTISHYAGKVRYNCDGFTESNKDTLYRDLIQLMQGSNNPFIQALFPETFDDTDRKRPTTVSHKIKTQSQELVDTLTRCTPSYIRCIKPNESKRPRDWDGPRVEHQVRYLNLKENINVRRAGFCYRNYFAKFLRRFAILTPQTWPQWSGDVRQGIQHIMNSVNMAADEWQLGREKVFIKSPESLFLLEEQRDRKFHGYAKVVQRAWRLYKSRKYFLDLRAKAAEVVLNKKERKRFSINRDFVGDYLNFLDNPVLKAMVPKGEKVFFADMMTKYDRKMKSTRREILVTQSHVYMVGQEKMKDGPNKGQWIKIVKRRIPMHAIQKISLSTRADDFLVLNVANDYDTVFENLFKTELLTVLSEQFQATVGRPLALEFTDTIVYSVKKTTFQRASTATLTFALSNAAEVQPGVRNLPIIQPHNHGATILVAPGLPSSTQPSISRRLRNTGSRPAHAQSHQHQYQHQQQAAYPAAAPAGIPAQPAAYGAAITAVAAGVGGLRPPGSARGGYGAANESASPAAAASQHAYPRPMSSAPVPQASPAALMAAAQPGAAAATGGASPAGMAAAAAARKKAPPPVPPPKKLPQFRALYDYDAQEADELTLRTGDVVYVTRKDEQGGWWTVSLRGKTGLVPGNYLEAVA